MSGHHDDDVHLVLSTSAASGATASAAAMGPQPVAIAKVDLTNLEQR